MQELVKYSNEINKIKMKKFNSMDLNILMKICVELNKQGISKIEIPFNEIKESIGYNGHKTKFINLLSDMCKKIGCLEMWNDDGFEQIFLFKKIKGIKSREVLSFEVNKEYIGFFLELQKQFTAFPLEDFVKIEGKYTKNLYRLVMQWKTRGHCPTEHEDGYFTIEEIKGFLNAPMDYEIKYLKRDVLDPAVKELNDLGLIKNLELMVHKAKKRGAPVVGYSFKFTPFGSKKLSDKQQKAVEHKKNGTYEATKPKAAAKNKFKNFDERKYSDRYYQLMEKMNAGITLTDSERAELLEAQSRASSLVPAPKKEAKPMTPEQIQEYEKQTENAVQMELNDFLEPHQDKPEEPKEERFDANELLNKLSKEQLEAFVRMIELNYPEET